MFLYVRAQPFDTTNGEMLESIFAVSDIQYICRHSTNSQMSVGKFKGIDTIVIIDSPIDDLWIKLRELAN